MQQDNTTTAEYTYDNNGNLLKDANKGILGITYNYLNLPVSITKTGGTRIEYSYDAAGTKRQQRYFLNGTLTKTTDFYTNFVYENSVPAWVTYDEGRVVLNSNGTANINEAYIKDHLGNIRVVYYYQAGSLKTQQVNSYYPFGMNIKGLTANGSATYKPNKYLYNGKMMQDEMGLGWLDYGARFYDPVLGRWHSLDPLAELGRRWSPYCYAFDNPMRFEEPDGMWPWEAKNVRDTRKEARHAGVKPNIWESNSIGNKTWASVDYAKSSDYKGTAHSDVKAFKPEGKSWGESYRGSKFSQWLNGNKGDIAVTGSTSKEGFEGALKITGVIAGGGALLEAASVGEIILTSLSLCNSIDDIGKNKNGEGLIQQNIKDENAKEIVGDVKATVSALGAGAGVTNISKTLESPFQIISTTLDAISTGKSVQKKIEDPEKPK